MRRMRDYGFLMLVPAVVGALGLAYLYKKHGPAERGASETLTPADFPPPLHATRERGERGRRPAADSEAWNDETPAQVERRVKTARRKLDAQLTSAECGGLEFRGQGPDHAEISARDWNRVMRSFHEAKADLLAWLRARRADLPERTAVWMGAQVADLRIQRPPVAEEAELNWRGIAQRSVDTGGKPIVRLGSGFVKLAASHPERARFELARVLAQGWAPCVMKSARQEIPWNPLLQCLGVDEPEACSPGGYSEGSWAVSTTLAATVAPPGCTVPAFQSPERLGCLRTLPLRALASAPLAHDRSEGARQ